MRRTGRLIATVTIVAAIGVGMFGYPRLARYLEESAWIEDLVSPDLELRRAAIEGLAQYQTRRAVDPLLDVAKRDEEVGPDAARALARIGDPRAIAVLKTLLLEAYPEFRRRAAAALSETPISPGAAEGLFVLAMSGRGKNEEEVFHTASAGVRAFRGDYVSRLVERLSSEDSEEVLRAARFLGSFREDGSPAADALIEILTRGDPELCEGVGLALRGIGPAVVTKVAAVLNLDASRPTRLGVVTAISSQKSAVPVLVRLLSDPDYDVRSRVVLALPSVGAGSTHVATALIDAIYDPKYSIGNPSYSKPGYDLRNTALGALIRINAISNQDVSRLLPLLEDPEPRFRVGVFEVITTLRPNDEEVAKSVDRVLDSWDLDTLSFSSVWSVLEALEKSGFRSEGASRFLRRVVASCSWPAICPKAKTLLAGYPWSSVESVLQAVRGMASGVGSCSVLARGLAGSVKAAQIPELAASLDDPDSDVRAGLCCLFRQLGTTAASAVPDLIRRLQDDHPQVRSAAAYALSTVAARDASLREHYSSMLRDANTDVRRAAIYALGTLRGVAKPYLTQLSKSFDASRGETKSTIAQALLAIDSSAAETVHTLTKALADSNVQTRTTVAHLLSVVPSSSTKVLDALEAMLNETGAVSGINYDQARRTAATSLVAHGVKGARRVIKSLRKGPAAAKDAAVRALLQMPDKVRGEGIAALREAMKGADPQLASTARQALEILEKTNRP
ncbi:MAG: HEAT repeat domain-containing protein [Planctomycetota bacterium]